MVFTSYSGFSHNSKSYTKDNRHSGHAGVPKKRNDQNSFVKSTLNWPPWLRVKTGKLGTAKATLRAKKNSKYNNCTLECLELSTCTELSLQFNRTRKYFFRVVGTTRTNNKNFLGILFSFIEKAYDKGWSLSLIAYITIEVRDWVRVSLYNQTIVRTSTEI